ncbi:GntR family transcriptional regulator [Lentzea sp. BCCO 10_0856]|uniref:GntR family transcriptional regulator n=1 Tax=Lentzea miocenica TaxID=3095431 RepID=A0ABU4SVC2_9PSEU|nr:GntR family transcriptional regulator [Lentzea sp. BCCO 10_0856]MDX8029849.1 GntR family transcriptional regulator [Lentzea sp. BCCO 10_0856]
MTETWVSTLAQGKADLERASTAQKVADMLRERVLDGELAPGLRLSEEAIGGALGVSRNTLREAFRLLTRDRLLVHEHSRGVFVRRPTGDDVRDLYAARRVIECGALRRWNDVTEALREAARAPVRQAVTRAEKNDWTRAGQANIQFHRAIVRLAGSERLNEESDRLFAELMLAFNVAQEINDFYQSYVPWNLRIVELLNNGEVDQAVGQLTEYLDAAEQDLVSRLEAQ